MDLMDLPMCQKLEGASTIQILLGQIWIIAKACLLMEWNTGPQLDGQVVRKIMILYNF